jgi:CRP/FNR family cyclic AMP-dependent transcriptional regulator
MAIASAARANYWYLKNSGISETIGRSALQRLAYGMETRTLRRNEMLFSSELGVCYLIEGSVGVSRIDPSSGKEIILYIVKPGEFFGHSSSKGGDSPTSVTRALQTSRVGCVRRKRFDDLMLDDSFRDQVQRNLESRLMQLENRIEELLFNRVKSRLARLLLRLSGDFPGECPEGNGTSIAITLTQTDIACLIAASREITSLTLNELRRAGIVGFHDHRICIHDAAALKRMSAAT